MVVWEVTFFPSAMDNVHRKYKILFLLNQAPLRKKQFVEKGKSFVANIDLFISKNK
jgi:hypothetical protein